MCLYLHLEKSGHVPRLNRLQTSKDGSIVGGGSKVWGDVIEGGGVLGCPEMDPLKPRHNRCFCGLPLGSEGRT